MKQTSRDRIGDLPDGILHYILSLLPIRSAVRTGVLSRRWRNLWKHTWINATKLNFDEEFTNAPTPIQFVDTVNHFIHLHNGKKIESFRISFHLHDQHQASVEKWIEFTTLKGMKELDLDFSQGTIQRSFIQLPDFLFNCNSLTHLNLSLCEFNPPLNFFGFSSLETLQLKQVAITDEKLESVISSCPNLKILTLIECFKLHSIRVVGTDLQLKSLKVLHCWNTYELEILAPILQSFHFYGDLLYTYLFENISALVDAFLSSDGFEQTEPKHDYINILSGLSHLKIRTICTGPLEYISSREEHNHDDLPITFPNLIELQLLMGLLNMEYLGYVYSFFMHTISPSLEKLFLELGSNIPTGDSSSREWDLWKPAAEEPSCCVFHALRTIKITNFRGSEAEMRWVKFFLEKAVILESLVLLSPRNSYSGEENNPAGKMDSQLRLLEDRLSSLP
ncbi:F-box/FBD/LRR-repeat protein At1g13570-like [Telopea speciosissima]|uniref:F-box/FBD/LRR-repeat protein At1g13570-like n=1 Tax=Telopea speciosissima TaxID=54955 RepID=UPI001CC59660|nr:F-box/FBD/LRR-repeat protein At1g13570-like [Telopea speciosissima]